MSAPCDLGNRSLLEHTKGTVEIATQIAESDYGTVASKRLTFMGVETSKEEFVRNTAIACILHDIGKASIEYQKNFSDNCAPRSTKKPSFLWHEIISASFSYKILSDSDFNSKQNVLITLAVANHMCAAGRYLGSDGFENGFRELKRNPSYFILHKGVSQIYDYLEEFLNKVTKCTQISVREADILIASVTQAISSLSNRWAKLYTLYLAPLSAGDNIDAEKRNQDEGRLRKKFTEELKRTLGMTGISI